MRCDINIAIAIDNITKIIINIIRSLPFRIIQLTTVIVIRETVCQQFVFVVSGFNFSLFGKDELKQRRDADDEYYDDNDDNNDDEKNLLLPDFQNGFLNVLALKWLLKMIMKDHHIYHQKCHHCHHIYDQNYHTIMIIMIICIISYHCQNLGGGELQQLLCVQDELLRCKSRAVHDHYDYDDYYDDDYNDDDNIDKLLHCKDRAVHDHYDYDDNDDHDHDYDDHHNDHDHDQDELLCCKGKAAEIK